MKIEWVNAAIFLSVFLGLVGLSHFLYKKAGLSSEVSRKFLHITGGVLSMFSIVFFRSHFTVLVLCTAAFLFLLLTYLCNLLPAIHKTKRRSWGSIIFPVPVYICFLTASLLHNRLYLLIPLSLLTISDALAEWCGKKWGSRTKSFFNGQKTLAGAAGFFISALVLSAVWIIILEPDLGSAWLIVIAVSLFSTLAELISTKGFDNLTVPLTALAVIYLCPLPAYFF